MCGDTTRGDTKKALYIKLYLTIEERREHRILLLFNYFFNLFRANNYDFATNNCICFSRAVCEFLGVLDILQADKAVVDLQEWLETQV